MPDKIVNHFVLADGSTAKYDAGSLVNLDETVSLAGYAPDAKAVGDKITDTINNIPSLSYIKRSKNRFHGHFVNGFVNQVTGEFNAGGTTYKGTEEYVEVFGAPFVFWINSTASIGFRYALYDETKTYISGAVVSNSDLTQILTPGISGNGSLYYVFNEPRAKYIRFSIVQVLNVRIQIEEGDTPTFYEPYEPDADKLKPKTLQTNNGFSFFRQNVTNNAGINIPYDISIRKNKVYHLHANISNFVSLYFGHGQSSYSLYFKLDNTSITFMTNGTEGTSFEHGLTLSVYVDIMLIVGQKNIGTLIVNTLDGTWSRTVQIVNGYKGYVFVNPVGCNLTNVFIGLSSSDFTKDLWCFGDSYFTHTSDKRWTYYPLEWGFTNYLLNAFPGEDSTEALPQALLYLQNNGTPKYVVWCLGMNDPDTTTAINADWQTCVETLIETCNEKGVTPILATIPNTPTLTHTFKNDYVRNSGYRYIDFAKAVGAENAGATWYSGCLDTDGTHPTSLGARLLALQAIADVPELTY